ncbi:hypothetical protein [Variovorax sp. UC74_104]|uniref:hypothetical protein n=1 Tax=Variovorax sp. UC74_104 TaxID=3374555 RepID=UPI0037575E02
MSARKSVADTATSAGTLPVAELEMGPVALTVASLTMPVPAVMAMTGTTTSPSATLAPPLPPMLLRVQLTVWPLTEQVQPVDCAGSGWIAKLAGMVSVSVTPVGAVPLKLGLSLKLKCWPTSSWPPSWLLASAST